MRLTFPGGGFFPSPKPPALPPPPPPLPTPEDPSVKAAKKKSRLAAVGRKGLLNTVKTSGLGDTSKATTQRKTLLGS